MYALIVNPIAGNGRTLTALPDVERILRERSIEFEVFYTAKPGDAVEIARACAERDDIEALTSVGGDGTLFEIVNGMNGSKKPLIICGLGTGNDFVKAIKLPKQPLEALKLQLDSPIKSVDLGRMNDYRFTNVSGTGLDVEVLKQAIRYKAKHPGITGYIMGVLSAVKHYKSVDAYVSIDGEPEEMRSFSILSLGNGNYIGGGMKAVPDAVVDDGVFDLVIVRPVKKWEIPWLLVLFIFGKHAKTAITKNYRCKRLYIKLPGMTVNLDGELIDCDEADFELLPEALNLRLPN